MMKLTNDQIEAIRAVSPELADKLESGEAVTLERAVEKWEPNSKMVEHMSQIDCPEALAACKLTAYRDQFAPGYVGDQAWFVAKYADGKWHAERARNYISPAEIYMPADVCQDLCRKLNSGEVVL